MSHAPGRRKPRIPISTESDLSGSKQTTANLRTRILDFTGFDSSIILTLRGGILMSIGNLPEVLNQQILVGIILAGRVGAPQCVTERDSMLPLNSSYY